MLSFKSFLNESKIDYNPDKIHTGKTLSKLLNSLGWYETNNNGGSHKKFKHATKGSLIAPVGHKGDISVNISKKIINFVTGQ